MQAGSRDASDQGDFLSPFFHFFYILLRRRGVPSKPTVLNFARRFFHVARRTPLVEDSPHAR